MTDAAIELTRIVVALEECTQIRSLFHLAAECQMHYSYGWRVLNQAEAAGLVTVERSRPPAPLVIRSTENGRRLVADKQKWAISVI